METRTEALRPRSAELLSFGAMRQRTTARRCGPRRETARVLRNKFHRSNALCAQPDVVRETSLLTTRGPLHSFMLVAHNGGDLDSTGSVTLWLRAQLLSAGKTLGKIITANTELALAA